MGFYIGGYILTPTKDSRPLTLPEIELKYGVLSGLPWPVGQGRVGCRIEEVSLPFC